MKLKCIDSVWRLRGKRVLLRIDLNIPFIAGVLRDDFRLKKSIKTINYLKEHGAKVILISHTETTPDHSLLVFSKYLNIPFFDIHKKDFNTESLSFMKNGDVVLLENLRKDPGEKRNSIDFAKKLASLGDIFVNEAFSASHREHASIIGLPKLLPTYFGFLFIEEINNLSRAFSPDHPFVFVLGGAKLGTKLPLVKKFLNIADKIFICGALSNNFFKEKGFETGISLVDESMEEISDLMNNPKIVIPRDVVVGTKCCRCVKRADNVEKEDLIGDAGPDFLDELDKAILSAKFILWNGPLGVIEAGFVEGTRSIAKMIAISDAISIIGGGDTVAAIKGLDINDRFDFVSTGGGAMLDFLAHGTLPGIDAALN